MIRALWRSRITLACCALIVGACGARTSLEIRAQLDGTPLENLHITALPFDPDDLLDSLAAASPTPRPDFGDLEAQLRDFRPTDDSAAKRAASPWLALRDTVTRLADSLNAADRRAPDYSAAYERFRTLYRRLSERTAERDAALRRLNGPDLQLARRAQTAADSLRAWEYDAFQAYPDVARQKVERLGRPAMETTTDSSGVAELALASGAWWIVARWPDPGDPFMEYYWNVPVHVNGWLPAAVPLHRTTAVRRWRH